MLNDVSLLETTIMVRHVRDTEIILIKADTDIAAVIIVVAVASSDMEETIGVTVAETLKEAVVDLIIKAVEVLFFAVILRAVEVDLVDALFRVLV